VIRADKGEKKAQHSNTYGDPLTCLRNQRGLKEAMTSKPHHSYQKECYVNLVVRYFV
jgi:hypothetical protein